MTCITKSGFSPLKPKIEKVELPEVGPDAYVNVRELGSKDLLELQKSYGVQKVSNLDFVYDLFARTFVDDQGRLIFEDKEDCAANFNLPVASVDSLCSVVLKVSGLNTEKN